MRLQFKKPAALAVLACAGLLTLSSEIKALTLPDGSYRMEILETPELIPGLGIPDTGCIDDVCINTSFSFGGLPSPTQSQRMKDYLTAFLPFNNEQEAIAGGITPNTWYDNEVNGRGSTLPGDGLAGSFEITVSGNTFNVTAMQVDAIPGTAASTFVQHFDTGTANMSGTIDHTTGAMTLTPTDRLGSTSTPVLLDNRWNVDDVTTLGKITWETLTTGSLTNSAGTVTGTPITSLGDINNDTLDDFHVVLVVASQVGTDWGTFTSASVIEVWSIDILSISPNLIDDSNTVTELTSQSIDVLANDGGTPILTITGTTDGTLGTVVIDGDGTPGTVTYTSTGGLGPDLFTYTVTDGDGASNTATVNIIVASSPAIAVDDNGTTDQEQTITINLIDNDSTSAGGETIDSATVMTTAAASGALVADNGDGSVDYTPPAGFAGADNFTYTVEDTAGNQSNVATVSVNVSATAISSAGNYAPGPLAVTAGSTSGLIATIDIPVTDTEATQACVGGCFDFIITGATNPTTVVLTPLTQSVPADATYRKLIGGIWVDLDTTTNGDSIASAPLSAGGGCPDSADLSWIVWNGAVATPANIGHDCLRLVIADDGANDSDAAAGTIADPGGIGTFPAANNSAVDTLSKFDSSESGGCTVSRAQQSVSHAADWWLVGLFIALLGWTRKRLTH